MTLNRREFTILTGAAIGASVLGLPAFAAEGDMYDVAKLMAPKGFEDRPIGPDDAKVTFIEYASPTCPHCAAFATEVYPQFKAEYVDTGKVKFIMRPFTRNVFDAVVFMLAATATDNETYNSIIHTYFETFSQWTSAAKPKDALLDIAKQLGFTEESFDAALTNQELFNGLEEMRQQALDEFGLTGTPTFYVNGKQLSGDKSLEALKAEIDPLLS